MMTTKPNIAAMKSDPSAFFDDPSDVVQDRRLSSAEKRAVLEVWAADCRELQVAEAEGLDGGESARLREVTLALTRLDAS